MDGLQMGEARDHREVLRGPLSPSPYPYSASKAEKVVTTLEGFVCCLSLFMHF